MYVNVVGRSDGSVTVTVEQPDDCQKFHVAGQGVAMAEIAAALEAAGGGTADGDHAWIEAGFVRRHAQGRVGVDWTQRFEGMLAYAARKEWLDADGRVRAHCELMLDEVHAVETADATMSVLVKRPPGEGPFPVVVMFHDGPGVRDATHDVARRVAAGGFYVAVPDRYNRFGEFLSVAPEQIPRADPNHEDAKRFFAMFRATTDDHVRVDLDALLTHVATDPAARTGPMGCIGYCIGARSALRAVAAHPEVFEAAVGLHPSFCVTPDADSPHHIVARSSAGFYFGFGEADTLQPVSDAQPLIESLRAGGHEVDIFPGAEHGFAVPGGAYDREASNTAYGSALRLFAERLGA